jgi:hypothetical protein
VRHRDAGASTDARNIKIDSNYGSALDDVEGGDLREEPILYVRSW